MTWALTTRQRSGASGSSAPVLFVGVTQTAGSDSVAGTLGNGSYVGAVQMDSGLPTSYIGDTSSSAADSSNHFKISFMATSISAVVKHGMAVKV